MEAEVALTTTEHERWQALPRLLHRAVQAHRLAARADPGLDAPVEAAAVRAALRAWDEASVDWRAALLAVDGGVQPFMDWVENEAHFRLFSQGHNDWTDEDGQALAQLSAPIWVDGTTRVTSSLVDLLVYQGAWRHYAAWLRSGWLSPSAEHVDHLRHQQGLETTLADEQREQQIQWVEALGEGRLIEWTPRFVRRTTRLR